MLRCETTDIVHRTVCLFTPQLAFAGIEVLITLTAYLRRGGQAELTYVVLTGADVEQLR